MERHPTKRLVVGGQVLHYVNDTHPEGARALCGRPLGQIMQASRRGDARRRALPRSCKTCVAALKKEWEPVLRTMRDRLAAAPEAA